MGDRERNKKRLLELLQAAGTGNAHCADCGAADPDWASYKLGIFICLNCSGVHRNFPDISKVKSVRLDFWDDSIVEFMTRNGNLRVKAKYEARVPAFYYVPQANDCLVLKEQWIRAKYERQEFMADGKIISPPGNREGFLWKRGRDNAQFLRRRFVLLAREGLLKYYTKEEGKDPKAVISIKDLNATFQTEKIGNPHGLQITYRREGHVRNLFVYHESGKEIVDWFNALRAARLQYLKMAFPELPESELVPLITRNYLKQGFMEKTGPKVAAQKSITEVGRELAELVDQLVDTVRSLQSQSCLPESEPDKDLRTLASALSDGVDLSLASPKLVTSNTPEAKMRDILHDLKKIQGKLQENFTWKGALEEQKQVDITEALSSSSSLLPDQSHLVPKRASSFAQWAISPTFDLGSLSCSLEVSEDHRTVTVSHYPQSYPWSPERFASCQVLGSQGFSSGQRYWEVDTQRCSHWAVGVASRGMRRDQILGRTSDSWCVEWNGASQLSAWHVVKQTVLGSDRPGVVGIWLDFEKEKLAFYSVADQEKLLYEYPVSASFALYPAFWLYGLYPGNSLTVRLPGCLHTGGRSGNSVPLDWAGQKVWPHKPARQPLIVHVTSLPLFHVKGQ